MLQFAQKLRNNGTPSNILQRHGTCYVGSCLQVSFLHLLPMAHKSNQSNLDSWPNKANSWLQKWSEWREHLLLFTDTPCAIVFKSCRHLQTCRNCQKWSNARELVQADDSSCTALSTIIYPTHTLKKIPQLSLPRCTFSFSPAATPAYTCRLRLGCVPDVSLVGWGWSQDSKLQTLFLLRQ